MYRSLASLCSFNLDNRRHRSTRLSVARQRATRSSVVGWFGIFERGLRRRYNFRPQYNFGVTATLISVDDYLQWITQLT